jgi:hypothetical protein
VGCCLRMKNKEGDLMLPAQPHPRFSLRTPQDANRTELDGQSTVYVHSYMYCGCRVDNHFMQSDVSESSAVRVECVHTLRLSMSISHHAMSPPQQYVYTHASGTTNAVRLDRALPPSQNWISVAEQSPRPRQHIGSGSGDGASVADGSELTVLREGIRELDPCREMFVLVRERE